MAKKKGKGCLIAIAVIVVLGVIISMFGGDDNNTPSSNVDSQQQTESKSAESEDSSTPEIQVTAVDLSKAFHENELKGKDTYTGKIAEISGTVQSIDEMMGKKFIVLDGDVDNYENIVSIQCFLKEEDSNINRAKELSIGDNITVVGKIGEKSMNLDVNNCIIK